MWLRAAATAVRRGFPLRDVRGGLGHTTFETVRGSLSRRSADEGRRVQSFAEACAGTKLRGGLRGHGSPRRGTPAGSPLLRGRRLQRASQYVRASQT